MACDACGGATELVDSQGGTTEGRFSETYRCVNCGAHGWVRGEAGKPAATWTQSGAVFGEGI